MKTFALKFLAASLLISFSACSDDDKDAPAVPDLKPQVQVKEITRGNSTTTRSITTPMGGMRPSLSTQTPY